ncbi:MAG: bifunctional molybdenum cofactor biosynthesis protein MoaC/MoaB [Bacteroidota bacterium]
MVNITHKQNSLRKAIAMATVKVSSEKTISAIQNNQVPKGDVFSFAKVAAFFAIKKTSDAIPDCHPLPVEFSDVRFEIKNLSIEITVEVHTVYKTGVEVEAMHGASIAALTVYDMLKPIDKEIEIQNIRLLHKEGGKSQFKLPEGQTIQASVIVCSDTVYQKKAEDKAGIAVIEKLKVYQIQTIDYEIIPDEATAIRQQAEILTQSEIRLLIFVGGTGVSPRDITPDVIKPMLDKELTGIMEQARRYGQDRMPYAMLSRSVAGFINNTLVLTLPGSVKGASEYIDALFPQVLHSLDIVKGKKH